ncbi:hypothetical protein [Hoeflea sp. 108]|uniref:hypothetical protein n=1 Tax=Hoeflea sp. 108 TaxID=1116369 RepID=UPI001FDA2313|nr:hypothetical protein [Hoeflea sp. 108]
MAAAIMEQRRLGLIAKAMLTVPGHCLAQGRARIPGALPERPHSRCGRDELHQGQAGAVAGGVCVGDQDFFTFLQRAGLDGCRKHD